MNTNKVELSIGITGIHYYPPVLLEPDDQLSALLGKWRRRWVVEGILSGNEKPEGTFSR